MCNLCSMTTNTKAIPKLVQEWEDAMRNIPPLYAIYPDYTTPSINQRGDSRCWDLPVEDRRRRKIQLPRGPVAAIPISGIPGSTTGQTSRGQEPLSDAG